MLNRDPSSGTGPFYHIVGWSTWLDFGALWYGARLRYISKYLAEWVTLLQGIPHDGDGGDDCGGGGGDCGGGDGGGGGLALLSLFQAISHPQGCTQ